MSGSDLDAEYSAFILDRILAQEFDPEEKPHENLEKTFLKLH